MTFLLTLLEIVPQDAKDLGDTASKFGMPIAVLTICMPLVPFFMKYIKAKIAQTNRLTESLPRIENHLHSIASSGQSGLHLSQEMLRGQQRAEVKIDRLLSRRQ